MHSNETAVYNLPIFQAGDTPAWLVDFNGLSNNVEKGLVTVKATADAAQQTATGATGSVAQINQQLVTLNNTIQGLNAEVNAVKTWRQLTLTPGASTQSLRGWVKRNTAMNLLNVVITLTLKNTAQANETLFNLGVNPSTNRELMNIGWLINDLSSNPTPLYPATLTLKTNGDVSIAGVINPNTALVINNILLTDGWFN